MFNIIFGFLGALPKRLLVGLAACFVVYFLGVSHGRAPYKLAAAVQDARAAGITKRTDSDRQTIRQKGRQANETIKDNECILNDVDASKLHNISAN